MHLINFLQVPQLVYWSVFRLAVVAYWPSLPSGTVSILLLNVSEASVSSQLRNLKASSAVGSAFD